MSATCDGCESLSEHRRWWANELGNLSCILSLAFETKNWEHIRKVSKRLGELKERIGA